VPATLLALSGGQTRGLSAPASWIAGTDAAVGRRSTWSPASAPASWSRPSPFPAPMERDPPLLSVGARASISMGRAALPIATPHAVTQNDRQRPQRTLAAFQWSVAGSSTPHSGVVAAGYGGSDKAAQERAVDTL